MKKDLIKFYTILAVVLFVTSNIMAATNLTKIQAEQKLREGNERFVSGTSTYPNLDYLRRQETNSNGQHPYATVITCSDSRVPVECVFDAGIGDIFVIRVAGNVVDVDEAGSIEYGVEHLSTPVLVILGHSSCGAVTAVAQNAEVHGNIPALIDNIIPAVDKAKALYGSSFSEEMLDAAIRNNVWQSIEDLLSQSHITAELVQTGKLKIIGAVYHLSDGHVEWLGEHPSQSQLLASASQSENEHTTYTQTESVSTYNEIQSAGIFTVDQKDSSTLIILLVLAGIVLMIYLLLINKNTALKLNLRGKVLSVGIAVTVLLITVSVANYFFLNNIEKEIESIADEDIILTEYITEIEKNALQQEIVMQKILTLAHEGVYRNRDDINELEIEFNQLSEGIDEQLGLGLELCNNAIQQDKNKAESEELSYIQGRLNEISNRHGEFESHILSMFNLVNNNRINELADVEQNIETEAANIANLSAAILDSIEKFTEASTVFAVNNSKKAMNINIIVSIIAMIIGVILGLVIAVNIAKQLGGEPEEVADISNRIAQGDLSFDLEKYGQRGGAMRNMLDMAYRLKDIVMNIVSGADNIASASQQMSSTSQEMSQGANEQASSVEEVTSTMEEISANIEQNTENAQQTEKTSIAANESMSKVSDSANKAVEANQSIAEKITIINDIAFQTNILALNAAVEAARAGEYGKGFAVVAAEVRKLAERSKIAAEEIVHLANNGLQLTQNAGQLLSETIPQIENTTKLVQEITAASIEQNNGAGQVSSAMQQLNSVTQQNAAASEELATGSEELASQAEQLRDLVDFFNTGMSKTTNKAPLISHSAKPSKPVAKKENKANGVLEVVADAETSDEQFEKF